MKHTAKALEAHTSLFFFCFCESLSEARIGVAEVKGWLCYKGHGNLECRLGNEGRADVRWLGETEDNSQS